MQNFNPHDRPPFICPKEYCYNWEKTPYSPEPYCTARRKCTRMYPDGRIDALEPNEKKLTEGGLPWFYFTIPLKRKPTCFSSWMNFHINII